MGECVRVAVTPGVDVDGRHGVTVGKVVRDGAAVLTRVGNGTVTGDWAAGGAFCAQADANKQTISKASDSRKSIRLFDARADFGTWAENDFALR